MSNFEVVVPKLGEAVIEATITKWLKNVGEMVTVDEPIVEIATDKVDSEINAPVSGKLVRKLFNEGDLVAVGAIFSIIETSGDSATLEPQVIKETPPPVTPELESAPVTREKTESDAKKEQYDNVGPLESHGPSRFYSPLVKSIARQENISFGELDTIKGTGIDDRLTKHDILNYLSERATKASAPPATQIKPEPVREPSAPVVVSGDDRIMEMDRIRQIIANHMVKSVQTSPHVTSFMEADMSKIVQWREKNKDSFQKRENEKLTFTPIFIDAISRAVRDFPMMNVSVDGTRILIHKNINIGMAVALPNFNLIVPVVRNTQEKNLLGIVKNVNDLAERARLSKLVPDEISGGTISLTNLGSFGTLMGTPIINQPQTAIVAVGAIKKRAVVVETPEGDVIAIRPIMMISVTYDHRVIDGALGGQFLTRLVQYLENFDVNQSI